jgi:hypothetical protein
MQIYNLEMREAAEVAEAANEVDNSSEAYAANQSNMQLIAGNDSVNMQGEGERKKKKRRRSRRDDDVQQDAY